jgi:hypothetical protein
VYARFTRFISFKVVHTVQIKIHKRGLKVGRLLFDIADSSWKSFLENLLFFPGEGYSLPYKRLYLIVLEKYNLFLNFQGSLEYSVVLRKGFQRW